MRLLHLISQISQRAPTGLILSLSALASIGVWLIALGLDLPTDLVVPIVSLGAIFAAITLLYLKTSFWLNDSRRSSRYYSDRIAKKAQQTVADLLTEAVSQIREDISVTQRDIDRVGNALDAEEKARTEFQASVVDQAWLMQTIREQTEFQQALMARLEEQTADQLTLEARISGRHDAFVLRLDKQRQEQRSRDAEISERHYALLSRLDNQRQAQQSRDAEIGKQHDSLVSRLEEQRQEQRSRDAESGKQHDSLVYRLEEQRQEQRSRDAEISDQQDSLASRLEEQRQEQRSRDTETSEQHNALAARVDWSAEAQNALDSRLSARIGDFLDSLENERSARVAFQEQTASQKGATDAESQRVAAELKDLQDAVVRSSMEVSQLVHEQQLERVSIESAANQRLDQLTESLESEHAARIESEKHDAAVLDDLNVEILSRIEEADKGLTEGLRGVSEQAQNDRKDTLERFGSLESNVRTDLESVNEAMQERLDSVPDVVKESVETEFAIQAQYRDSQWQGSPWSSTVETWEQKGGSTAGRSHRIKQPGVIFLHMSKTGGTSVADAIARHYPHSKHWIDVHTVYEYVQRVHGLTLNDPGAQELIQPAIWAVAYYHLQKGTKFVYGHILYDEFLKRFKDSNYILTTLLRDPVDRWLSHYFWRRYAAPVLKQYDTKKRAGELMIPGIIEPVELQEGHFSVEGAISDTKAPWAKSLGRLQARFLGGYIDDSSEEPSKIVEQAKRNLDEFDIVGTLEHLDSFSSHFRTATGDELALPHANKSRTTADFQLLKDSSELRAAVEDVCAPDIELYEYALTKI